MTHACLYIPKAGEASRLRDPQRPFSFQSFFFPVKHTLTYKNTQPGKLHVLFTELNEMKRNNQTFFSPCLSINSKTAWHFVSSTPDSMFILSVSKFWFLPHIAPAWSGSCTMSVRPHSAAR